MCWARAASGVDLQIVEAMLCALNPIKSMAWWHRRHQAQQ
jgi:hypothetical protein